MPVTPYHIYNPTYIQGEKNHTGHIHPGAGIPGIILQFCLPPKVIR